MKKKRCSKCQANKRLDDFANNQKNADGHQRTCKECHNASRRARSARKKTKTAKAAPRARKVRAVTLPKILQKVNKRNGRGTGPLTVTISAQQATSIRKIAKQRGVSVERVFWALIRFGLLTWRTSAQKLAKITHAELHDSELRDEVALSAPTVEVIA